MKTKEIKAALGSSFKDAADRACSVAVMSGCHVSFDFQGIKNTASPGDTADRLWDVYKAETERRRQKRINSPEYKADTRPEPPWFKRRREEKAQHDKIRKWVSVNTTPGGSGVTKENLPGAWTILRRLGIYTTNQAKQAVEAGILVPENLAGYGKRKHAVVCGFCGIPMPAKIKRDRLQILCLELLGILETSTLLTTGPDQDIRLSEIKTEMRRMCLRSCGWGGGSG